MSYDDEFDKAFASRARKSLVQSVAEGAGGDWDEEAFRGRVSDNLAAGRFRLVIAVDQITDGLKETVLYLNQHTLSDVQFLALQLGYIADEGVEILVPQTFGEESAQARAGGSSSRATWNADTLFAALADSCTDSGLAAAKHLYAFAEERGAPMNWGTSRLPSLSVRFPVHGKLVSVFTLFEWPEDKGMLSINFEYLTDAPRECLTRLADRLRTIPGVAKLYDGLEASDFKKRPSLPIDEVSAQPGAVETIESALDEFLACANE